MRRFPPAILVVAAVSGCGLAPSGKGQVCLRTFSGHTDSVCSVAFSPDGKQLASGGADGKIRFWDVESGECRRALDGHAEWVHSVAFSPDGRFLASGGRDALVKLWDVETGELLKTFSGHSGIVTSVAYSPDGRLLASCGRHELVWIWDVASGKSRKTLDTGGFFTASMVAFSPDSKQLLFAGDSLQLWDIDGGARLRTFEGHSDSVGAIAMSRDGKRIASAGSYQDSTLRLWDAETGACLWKKDSAEQGGGAWSLTFASADGVLVSGHHDGRIRYWDVVSGDCLAAVPAHSEVVSTLSADADGRYVASGGWDKCIRLWEAPSAKPGASVR
jgi:WD40 repeat protein